MNTLDTILSSAFAEVLPEPVAHIFSWDLNGLYEVPSGNASGVYRTEQFCWESAVQDFIEVLDGAVEANPIADLDDYADPLLVMTFIAARPWSSDPLNSVEGEVRIDPERGLCLKLLSAIVDGVQYAGESQAPHHGLYTNVNRGWND